MLVASVLVALVLLAPGSSGARGAATPAVAATPIPGVPSPGAAGIGDRYYPLLGNGGYDAIHYTIDLDLDIEAGSILDATATIAPSPARTCPHSTSTSGVPRIDAVAVDGERADWTRDGGELTITPARPLSAGQPFQAEVRYHGKPEIDENDRFERGWWTTDRSIFTVGEPAGADVWYPVNGHPRDKSTYTLVITVPEPYEVVSNGQLAARWRGQAEPRATPRRSPTPGKTSEPTASYLVMFHAADLEVTFGEGPGGITVIEAFPPDLSKQEKDPLRSRAGDDRGLH